MSRRVCTCVIALTLLGPPAAAPLMADRQREPAGRGPATPKARLLDVPFVPQSEALCGGAAAAMVVRYWRASPVYAEDFASLVDDSAEGIRIGDLTRAIQSRGWRAAPFAATLSDVQGHVGEGRPVIALIEDRPGRHHYVVVIAFTGERIVFHDPARGPFRVIDTEAFQRRWDATNRTALLILPEPGPVSVSSAEPEPPERVSATCGESVQQAIELARAGDLGTAEALLSLAAETCPGFAGAWRELAGLRFLEKRWPEAAALAEQAVARDPSDMHAWQLLASARFLRGDAAGALRAWNRRNEPRVDLARVDGLGRTHYQIVSDLLNLPPHTLLTESQLERARRRIAELPALELSRVSYSPRANGLATVDVAILERTLLPNSWPGVGAIGLRAATDREARIRIASPTGNGELWTAAWRWWGNRPRIALSMAAPQLGGWTGLWRIDGEWERQTYRIGSTLMASERRRAAITFGDWGSGRLRWEVGGALENWRDRGKYLSAAAAIERRLLDDRLAVRAGGVLWPGTGRAGGFGSGALSSAWRSAPEALQGLQGLQGSTGWSVTAGLQLVSDRAPLDVWPAADTGHARAALLRAHPLLDGGVIRAAGLGRALAHTTLELQRDLTRHPVARLRWAAFIDVARQGKMLTASAPRTEVDLGGGLRAQLPGAAGTLRIDVARGMRDGRVALSAGWQSPWPGW